MVAVPAGWAVKRAAGEVSASTGEDIVSVRTAPLQHAFRAVLARGAARELDERAAEVAHGLHGKATTTCTHCPKIRSKLGAVLTRGYSIRYGDLVQEITFVLVDKREYQLTCRRKQGGDESACARLRSSFRLI